MNIEIGQRVPMDVVWNTRVRDQEMADAGEENPYRWQSLTSGDLFKDRRIVLFFGGHSLRLFCKTVYVRTKLWRLARRG